MKTQVCIPCCIWTSQHSPRSPASVEKLLSRGRSQPTTDLPSQYPRWNSATNSFRNDFYKQAHFESAVLEFQKTSQESMENTAFDIWITEESSVCRITETITVLIYMPALQ